MIQRKHVAWVSICLACVASAEGMRTYVYRDPVGIPTYCFGETGEARPGRTYTAEECRAKLGARVLEYGVGVDDCITRPMAPNRKAAYVSLAYNVGVEAFCHSSVARKFNTGDDVGSCDAMLLYVKARGVTLPGLVKRRQVERDLCLS